MSWRQSESALRSETAVSRAINLNVEIADVRAACEKRGIAVSAIEALLSGGTRVVLVNAEGAEKVRSLYKTKLLDGPVTRTRWVANR